MLCFVSMTAHDNFGYFHLRFLKVCQLIKILVNVISEIFLDANYVSLYTVIKFDKPWMRYTILSSATIQSNYVEASKGLTPFIHNL